ncbi:hypothetical protein BDB01DRAFT_794919 [Pilobolus umbonatus]|nr:hypothetical protein BDB01DRAFT_794919 [Pilobolus umbonatus]
MDKDMDEESRQLIEQMLAEEQYFYDNHSLSTMKKPAKKKARNVVDTEYKISKKDTMRKYSKDDAKNNSISSVSLPSHKTRWNDEEDDKLKEALMKFGYGNWKLISEYIGTRNPLQCKNHTRHLIQFNKLDKSIQDITPKVESPVSTKQNGENTNQEEDATDISIEEDNLDSHGGDTIDKGATETHTNNENIPNLTENSQLLKQSNDTLHIPAEMPGTVPIFDRDHISEEEMAENPEWFRHKYSKTPDRYLRIRNHILDCWNLLRPRYLTKTNARRELKDCGDVNAIGRIHEYLERIGAINVDCITNAPRPPKRVSHMYEDKEEYFDAAGLVVGYEGPRKRKVRNEYGEWVDPRDLEGRVIEHKSTEDPKPKRVTKRSLHQYYGGDDFSRGYNPFRLVPTNHYSDDLPAPFNVEIVSDVLLVMDFHSHLAHTEIIGLLGGNFIRQGDTKILQVKRVFPCQSTSTGIQCEMDPASEMKAREDFREKGYTVVGWYHSHPTFEPHPSIRDIENQTSYQTLFREEKTGDEPFIGVIITPYDPEIGSDDSQIQYLHISKEWDGTHSFRIPYSCRRHVKQTEQVSPDTLVQFKELIEEYKHYEYKMDMMSLFGSRTRLDKLLDSLRSHLFIPKEEEDLFLDTVKGLIIDHYVDKED